MDKEFARRPYSLSSGGKKGRDKSTRATVTAILVAVSAAMIHTKSYCKKGERQIGLSRSRGGGR